MSASAAEELSRDYACMSFGRLDSLLQHVKSKVLGAKAANDLDEVQWLREQTRPALRRHQQLQEARRWVARVCPLEWVRGSESATLVSGLGHPALADLVRRPALADTGVLVLGPTGLGKSTALAIALRRAAADGLYRHHLAESAPGHAAVWCFVRELGKAVRAHPLGSGDAPLVRAAKLARVLILDDLGQESDHGEILDVIESRYEGARSTWITSGLTRGQLSERYGDALTRRFAGHGGLLVDCFGGGS